MRGRINMNGAVYEEILSADIEPSRLAMAKEAVIFAIKELDLPRPLEICWLRLVQPRVPEPGGHDHEWGFTQRSLLRRIYLLNHPLAPYVALHEARHLWQQKRIAEGDEEISAWSSDQREVDAYAYQPLAFARAFGKTRGMGVVKRMHADAQAEGLL